jgi:signal transduction histidine kinase
MDFFHELVSTEGFHPHGYCYLWRPGLIWLHVISDALIGLAYVGIGFGLAHFVRRGRGHLPFSRIFVAFGVFIAACGATHFVEIWTLWTPVYWLAGSVKVVTAAASVFTAVALPPLIPLALNTLASARVSEQRRIDLEEAHHRLMELDELKTQFFAKVSHELRTPLTLIRGPIEHMLREGRLEEPDRRRLETVQRNADLLLRHVNDLLEVAKLEAGTMVLDYRRTDLARLVRRASAHFESVAMTRAVDFRVETPDALPAEIDPDQIERVLLNLLANAVKFTPHGGEVRCILEIAGSAPVRIAPTARIEVHDSGPGVPHEQRSRIFEPFRQGSDGPGRLHGGTGLGLSIVSDLVALHGGSVHVEESPLGGAAFVVELPLVAPPGTRVAQGEIPAGSPPPTLSGLAGIETAPEPEDEPEYDARLNAAGNADWPLVLVVEDNREMSRYIAETLSREYRIARAFDGREGLARALELRPDLIVSDVMMPEVTGEALVREVRRHAELDATPILLLSARADDEVRLRLLGAGVQDYVTKPFSPEELRLRVGNWMAMKRARDLLRTALDTTQGDVEALATQITLRNHELEAALRIAREAFEEAEAANRAKADFLSVISHELRTPLNGIIGYVDLLEAGVGGPLSEDQQGYVERLKRSAGHLRTLVEEVLTFARIEAGAEQAAAHPVDLRDVVQEAESIIAPAASEKGLLLEVRTPVDPVHAETDPVKVRQILVNLAGNAVKFTDRGVVTLSLESEGSLAVLRVDDTGAGIDPLHLEKIFEPFWQADSSQTRKAGGTGLGLSITRRLVDLLGGEIRVTSELGTGSSFTVRLPTRGIPSGGPGAA